MNQLANKTTATFAAMAAVLIITFAMAMNVSAQSGDPDWKQSPTGLTVSAGDEAGELNIIWDAHPQTSKTLSDYRVTWTPDGEDFKHASETGWSAYPTTNEVTVTGLDAGATYQVRVRARYDDNKRSRWSDAVSGQTAPPTNTAATGQPTITGTAQVRETLTAIMSEIADDNGLTNAAFSHQWVRSANGTDNDVTDATASTYAVTNADINKAIKVRVSFTDDDGYSETLTSNATTPVPVPAPVIVPPEEPEIAHAEGDSTIVSNLNQTSVLNPFSVLRAQTFTTGSHPYGYNLGSIEFLYKSGNAFPAAIWTVNSFGVPTALLHQLTAPSTLSDGTVEFTAPAKAPLASGTTYTVMVTPDNTLSLEQTTSDNEDSGTSPGWSIGNAYHTQSGTVWASTGTGRSLLIAVKGTTILPDATLGTLAIQGATNGEAITLNPTFDEDTFTYTAAIANSITAVTLTATKNFSNAAVAITGDNNTTSPDTADLDLDVGTNTLTVTVTAHDGSTQTYTINITRIGVLPAPATVPPDWSLSPFTKEEKEEDEDRGQKFRLIFLSLYARNAQSASITDYNNFIRSATASGHSDIQGYSDGFTVVGCTEDVDARENTDTGYTNANKGVPIYWLNGSKVADDYQDFYDQFWDAEGDDHDRNERGFNGADTGNDSNFPWTGCKNDGTEASATDGTSEALGTPDGYVRLGRPNSSTQGHSPLSSDATQDSSGEQPMYGLSQVFTVVPSNTGTLTTGGTPRSDALDSSDTGHYWQVKLHQNVRYRIDVKGSESSQYGGTLTNPRIQVIAGSPDIGLLNGSSAGVYQTMTTTVATGGGAGHNSRLDIKVTGETKYYFLLIHRGAGDDGSYTVTVNRLDWPQGRLAPDITVNAERFPAIGIQWDEPAKTHHNIRAPIDGYKVQYRTLPDGNWETEITRTQSQRLHDYRSTIQGQLYEVRVRSYHSNEHPNNTYRWDYATVYADDCDDEETHLCSIGVNASEKGRINYDSRALTDGDIDGYVVPLVSGTTYVIKANGKPGNNTLVDPYLTLRPIPYNLIIASDDNGGQGLDSKITYTPTNTGDFLIQVSSSVAGERGTYTVTVTEQ